MGFPESERREFRKNNLVERTINKKMVLDQKYHHNKWLLYSSTVILVSFLLVVDHISVVECGVQQLLTAVENETTGKIREKVHGNSILDGNSLSSGSIGGYNRGKSGSNNGGGGSVNSNELHSTKFTFNGIDEEEEGEDEDSYGDEDASYGYDDDLTEDIKGADLEYIEEVESASPFGRPELGKCCPYGQGLNLQGKCENINPEHLKHHDKLWFPEKVFDGKKTYVDTNISEWDIRVSHRLNCKEGERTEIISNMKKFVVLNDGSLFIIHHEKVLHPLEFCMEQELGKGEGRVVRACFSKQELCDDRKCLRKCCPEGSLSEEPKLRCTKSHLSQSYNFTNASQSILSGTPECEFGSYWSPIEGKFTISENGSLQADNFTAPFLDYCIDYFLNTVEDPHHLGVPQRKAMICFPRAEKNQNTGGLIVVSQKASVVFGIANIISAICLAIAAAISWRLPELRSLHGKCQLSHLGTMFFLYVCLAIAQLGTVNVPQGLCTFIGVFIHICALSSFLWLNLLCVNIYLTFRSLRPPLAARRDENRRLIFLCIYAWGIPAAFCGFLFLLDSRLEPMPQPEYGKLKCLISNREAEFAYLFGPVGVLLLCNGILFCLTAQELLCGLWRLDNSDSINFRRKSMGIVVAKLGIVMGMGWILDVLSWAIGNESPYMFYAVDLFNSLQGVFISVILLWRKRVLEVLHLRRPSITKDETLTARPFLAKSNSINATNGDHDTSLVLVNEER